MRLLVIAALVLALATTAYGLEKKAVQMREDFGTEPLYDCYMHYYYYIPCPTSSWFWMYTNWPPNYVIGEWFQIGDPTMGVAGSGCPPYYRCDPCNAHTIQQFRILDFAGYGTVYPGFFTVEFQIWCCDDRGCPRGLPLWTSPPTEFCIGGWNYVVLSEPLCVSECGVGRPPCSPRILLTAKQIGSVGTYPAWGFDNISTPIGLGCVMHDTGCCPALYPRPSVSHYPGTMHTGDYGVNFAYCPPYWFLNPGDTTGDLYGCIELAWRLYLTTSGPTATEPSTWGDIKSMYK